MADAQQAGKLPNQLFFEPRMAAPIRHQLNETAWIAMRQPAVRPAGDVARTCYFSK
jgi:hypothetical protein